MQRQLDRLERTILEKVRQANADLDEPDEYEEDVLVEGVRVLDGILEGLDAELLDTLDEALNADGGARQGLQVEAQGLIKKYLNFLETDSLVQSVDSNGFTATSIRDDVQKTLDELSHSLQGG